MPIPLGSRTDTSLGQSFVISLCTREQVERTKTNMTERPALLLRIAPTAKPGGLADESHAAT
jgi:hypothetical protein